MEHIKKSMLPKMTSVKTEFSIWVITLLLATTFSLTWLELGLERDALRREVTKRGLALAQYVAAHAMDPFLTNDKLTLATLVADIMKNEDVVYALITDRNGRLVASDQSPMVGQAYQRPAGSYPLDRPQPKFFTWQHARAGLVIDIGIPLILEAKAKIGEVHVGLSQAKINQVLFVAGRNALVLASLFALAGLIGSIVMVTLMLRPVSELTKGARAIGAGNLDYQIPAMRQNELGQLAGTFNGMTRELKKATEQALEQERIKKEMQVAQQIQQMLLPKRTPDIAGYSFASFYRAAAEVSGDYYDFFRVDNDRLAVVIADVCGKGVPAAMLMSVARSILRSVAPHKISPSEVVRELNHLILGDFSNGLFITLFYAVIDVKKRVMTYTSAGHNPVLIWHGARKEFSWLTMDPPCLPIGLDGSETFNRLAIEKKVLLHPGDVVILYTDGVTDAMNPQGEAFKIDGLMASLRQCDNPPDAQSVILRLQKDLEQFCREQHQSDDIAVVTMQVGSA